MQRSGFFISGTHTGIGKTLVSSILVSALHQAQRSVHYFKPLQTGVLSDQDDDDDTRTVRYLSGCDPSQTLPPVYRLPAPMAPLRAAQCAGMSISWTKTLHAWHEHSNQNSFFIIEGAGGLLVPITQDPARSMRELIIEFNLPLILVASTALGTINHTLLSLETADRAGIEIKGYILVGEKDPGLEECLAQFHPARCLAHLPKLSHVTPETVSTLAKEWSTYEFLQ